MVFPATPVALTVELDLVGDWSAPTDITSLVYGRDPVVITRGRSAEGATADPSTMTLTLDNRDGRFSPRNPTGPYYGALGRNTPIRASVLAGSVRATSTGTGTGFRCPDTAGTSVTGDIDIRLDLRPAAGWRFKPGTALFLASKYASPAQRSWYLELGNSGKLKFFWSADGTALLSAEATVPVPFPVAGRRAVRVTLDVNNGAGGKTVTFYTAEGGNIGAGASWTQLGDPVTTAGTTSIFNSTASTVIGVPGRELYALRIHNGIAGSVVANPVFTDQAEGTTSFADAQGNTWTADAGSKVTARRWRFYGEVSSWPQAWDPTGSDVWASVTAAGPLRRLGQGATALRSTLYRALTARTDVVAYWPAEDGARATQVGAGLDHPAMRITRAVPDFAAFSDFAASAPLPTLNGSAWLGQVPAYTTSGAWQVRFLLAVPAGGTTNGAVIARVSASGTAPRWDLTYYTGGGLGLSIIRGDGTTAYDSGSVAYAVNGKLLQVTIEGETNGAGIDFRFATMEVGGTGAFYTNSSLTPVTLGVPVRVQVNPNGTLTDTAVGHVYVQNASSSLSDLASQLKAYDGETAGARLVRLAGEEGLSAYVVGDTADTSAMGPQGLATLADLLRECADAEQGVLVEPRDSLGLVLVSRLALTGQAATLTLDYAAGHLSALDPVDDDQSVRNDVTVARPEGSSYRATLDAGALSTAAPPAGVGRYVAEPLTANVSADSQLPDLAGWRLHLGTVDEPRYPAIGVLLERAPYVASATLRTQVLDLDVAGLLEITDPPAWLPPDAIRQMVRGYTETLSNFSHGLLFVGDPASPWTQGIYDDPTEDSRYHSDGSTLNADATAGATSLSVATPSGPLWTTTPAEFPFDVLVAGERITVTAISGTSSPQTFTVTRAVNGISKAQTAGAAVDLFTPTYYAI